MAHFPEQKAEIERMLEESGLTLDQMSQRADVKIETLKKYASGAQSAGERVLSAMRLVTELELERRQRRREKEAGICREDFNPDAVELLEKIEQLPREKSDLVRRMVVALGDQAVAAAAAKTKRVMGENWAKEEALRTAKKLVKRIRRSGGGSSPSTPSPEPGPGSHPAGAVGPVAGPGESGHAGR